MASSNEEIGFDFDLLLPSQAADNTAASKLEYLRKSIRVAKKRTLVSNALVTQVLALRKELDAAQNSLIASNKERDEWYTSYNDGTASNKKLEMEIQKLQIRNKELEEKCFNTTNQYEAVKSHAHQLQLLVKENETQHEALKIENKLEKANIKDNEKTITSLKKNEQSLLKDISLMRDILVGKRKFRKRHNKVIQKYKKLNMFNDSDEFLSGDEDIEDDVNMLFDDVPIYCNQNISANYDKKVQNSSTSIKYKLIENNTDNGHQSDYANEITSVDTGRGSSLAFSDNDKYLHSPEYTMDDSPVIVDTVNSNKNKLKAVDAATSPIPKYKMSNTSTSPIIFDVVPSNQNSKVKAVDLVDRDTSPIRIIKYVDASTSPIEKHSNGEITTSETQDDKTTRNSLDLVDRDTSPIRVIKHIDASTSPIQKHSNGEITTSKIHNNKTSRNSLDLVDRDTSPIRIIKQVDASTSPLKKHSNEEITTLKKQNDKTSRNSLDLVDRDTSPIRIIKYIDASTSPIQKHSNGEITTSKIHNNKTTRNSLDLVERDTSPIRIIRHVDASISPIEKNYNGEITTSKIQNNKTTSNSLDNDHGNNSVHNEQQCLELNNSNIICDDVIDCEIETILSTMRINYNILTPIPLTPSKSGNKRNTRQTKDLGTQTHHSNAHVCKEAAQVKEENKKLNASLTELANEVIKIKSLLKKKFLINNKKHSKHSKSNRQIIDDSNTFSKDVDSLRECNIISSTNNALDTDYDKQSDGTQCLLEKCVRLEKCVCDSNAVNQSVELSVSNIIQRDNDVLHDPIKLKYSNIKQRLNIDSSSVSSHSLSSIPSEELSTNDIDVNDEGNLRPPRNNISSSNIAHRVDCNTNIISDSVGAIPNAELNTDIVTCDDDNLQAPIKITSSKKSLVDYSVTSDLTNADVIDDCPSNNILNDIKCSQVPIVNNFIPNVLLTRLHFEGSISPEQDLDIDSYTVIVNDIVTDTETNNTLNKTQYDYETTQENSALKIIKKKKLTKLDKIRKILIPKSKIKCGIKPLKKPRSKPKPLPMYRKEVKETDSAASLNDKSVYEKALKVMAEMKSKQNEEINETGDSSLYSPKKKYSKDTEVSPEKSKIIQQYDNNSNEMLLSPRSTMMTRSRSKNDQKITHSVLNNYTKQDKCVSPSSVRKDKSDINYTGNIDTQVSRKGRKRASTDKPEIHCKRMLRSSMASQQTIVESDDQSEMMAAKHSSHTSFKKRNSDEPTQNLSHKSKDANSTGVHHAPYCNNNTANESNKVSKSMNGESGVKMETYENTCLTNSPNKKSDEQIEETNIHSSIVVSYTDLQMFCDSNTLRKEETEQNAVFGPINPNKSILCVMLQKYGIVSFRNTPKNLSEKSLAVGKFIEGKIASLIDLPAAEIKDSMNEFVAEIQSLDKKLFIKGLMTYLNDPARRTELYNTTYSPPAPCMTKSEQVLLYVVAQLKSCSETADIFVKILDNIEYTLFKLNETPDFTIVESMSHFYAVLCRYFKAKSRLRLFILDAMYCIQFKAIALIKQCLDVWMHILPLAHMGVAKTPLVTCLVYLLHFYKCEDKFHRVQDIRNILNRKYFYEITEWNEVKILDMLKNALRELKDVSMEKKMLRMALIIVAKRHGPKWCQNNIIKKLLLPMIDTQNINNIVKHFCISMIGPLLKPYPLHMKVHCEVMMNQLLNMLQKNSSCALHEAILISLIFMSKHNQDRVNQVLLSWEAKRVSKEFESVLCDYVKEKPVNIWKTILSRLV